jgi:hypothetical protein
MANGTGQELNVLPHKAFEGVWVVFIEVLRLMGVGRRNKNKSSLNVFQQKRK